MPYEDTGACPFEGCVYREWVARRTTPVYRDRSHASPLLFQLSRGDRVQAITGTVVTTQPGVVVFTRSWVERYFRQEPTTRAWLVGRVEAQPGDILYLLTYQGEGHTVAWFKGQLLESLDASAFLNGRCDVKPESCPARIQARPTRVWWVQVRNQRGQVGWTNRPSEDFANKDAVGATFEEESQDAGIERAR